MTSCCQTPDQAPLGDLLAERIQASRCVGHPAGLLNRLRDDIRLVSQQVMSALLSEHRLDTTNQSPGGVAQTIDPRLRFRVSGCMARNLRLHKRFSLSAAESRQPFYAAGGYDVVRFAGSITHGDRRLDRRKSAFGRNLMTVWDQKRYAMAATARTEQSGQLELSVMIDNPRLELVGDPFDRLIKKFHAVCSTGSSSKDAVSNV